MNKKIIYNLDSLHNFSDYGISVPLLNNRVINTVNALKEKYHLEELDFAPVSNEDLLLVHTSGYIERVENEPDNVVKDGYELVNSDGSFNRFNPSEQRLPLNDFINKAKLHVAGTYLATLEALDSGFAYHIGGGMHHAMSSKPSGFCLFNDIAFSARKIIKGGKAKKVLVIDLDCHKGDGTAQITQNDESIYTFSIHMKNGWPLVGDKFDEEGKLNQSFIPSSCDVAISSTDNYLEKLNSALNITLEQNFDLAIVIHGVDVHMSDGLPSSEGIKLTTEELLERDLIVYNRLVASKTPQAWCLGGGYGEEVHKLYIQFLEEILE
ncbi:MAG: acetoin utilization deacetylase AcuC-like enzyme [Bacteriovoracaceae bacterium]